MPLRAAPCSVVLLVAALGFVACGPPPPAPAPATNAPTAQAVSHEHAHGEESKKSGKGKRDVLRVGVESLDVAVDGGTVHLLLGNYDTNSKSPALLHLRSADAGATWSRPVRVDAGAAAPHQPHRGQDAQIAASGTKLAAIWTTPGTGFMGRGPMATALSADGGATWQPGPNPADDASSGDHSFVDCAADAAGTFHLVWLDARGANKSKGLRYANSKDGGKTWSKNATLKPDTCECCWNTVAVGTDGSVHALFRDKNPRDMAVISSTDHGARWSDAAKVGRFNWDFQGCPHVGGGLIVRGSTLHALVWTGVTGHSGAYHLSSSDQGQSWSAPQRLGDADARRGDLASTGGQSLAAVWDRVSDGESTVLASTSANGGKTWTEPKQLSAKGVNAAYPRVVAVSGSYRVFWTESVTGQPGAWKSGLLTK
ncbi:MAG: BNR repeat-containing protein [Limisphaerales bacterium]|nr:MAG: BNR repeat-containing protein [Limisphaerales bacterium]KAG0510557.1 MAG: BNR repeat-containing protein [Limisphaerales bacterium]TXT52830.1 MAG: BNR repeat-containing protein [Limisphaerales bacterium]